MTDLKPHRVVLDLGILVTLGFLLGVILGPFFHLLFGAPLPLDGSLTGKGFSFSARTTSVGYLVGTILGGMAWFSVRRHREHQQDGGTHTGGPQWWAYGGVLTAAAAFLPIMLLQLLVSALF